MTEINHKTISSDRRVILFGLPWYSEREDENLKKSAAALARESMAPYDLFLQRKGENRQFALASTADGAKKKAFSAAAMIANMVEKESWIYVLEVDDSIWICAGRDGYILPFGDQVFDNREDARKAFQDLDPKTFKNIYLPANWNIDIGTLSDDGTGTEDPDVEVASVFDVTDLESFLALDVPRWATLTPISPVGSIMRAGAVFSVLALAGVVGMNILSKDDAPTGPSPDELAKRRAMMAERLRSEKAQRYADLDANRPWERAAPPELLLETCLSEIRSMPGRPIGYTIDTVTCNSRQVSATVSRDGGYSQWLIEWGKGHADIDVIVDTNGQKGYLEKGISIPSGRDREDLVDFKDLSRLFFTHAETEGSGVKLAQPSVSLVPNEPDYVPLFASSNFQVTSKTPDTWIEFFESTGGVALNRITFDPKDRSYSMEGKLYVPNF